MNISDEKLMAYADGELDAAQRAEVEAAMAADPEVARRVQQHQALRKQIGATFDGALMDTVPERLVAAVRSAPTGAPAPAAHREATVTDLRRVRAARAAEAAAAAKRAGAPRRPWTWVEWGAMAASVAAGAVIAHLALRSPGGDRIGTQGGQLVAQADLAQALSNQLASDPPADSAVQIGVSFKTKSGDHCRTFVVKDQSPLGGLACRQGDAWHVQVLASAAAPAGAQGGYKPASVEMPAAVTAAAQSAIDGEPFDAAAEAAARDKGWK